MACLDTSFLVDLGRSHGDLVVRAGRKLLELEARGEILATTWFSVAELYVGVELARDRDRELRSVRKVTAGVELLLFNDPAAWLFAELSARQRRSGRPAGDMDLLIASTALAAGHRLVVTRNPAHFTDIPDLAVESY
ncbi:MAG: type II toxin-antitoxin system VapC family toxin [Thermoguttaceae bacterium]|jgi:predicted nucleic acid-binding protein